MTTLDRADDDLEELLVCPSDRGPLVWLRCHDVVYNPRLGLGYPIRDGIAQLLGSESFSVDVDGTASPSDNEG
jgi:uncharacterized protein YbaR (Trm112 family)